jgi:hypothetical protein
MEGASDVRLKDEGHTASFHTIIIWVLLSGACHYFAAEIPWALCLPNRKVPLILPPRMVFVLNASDYS